MPSALKWKIVLLLFLIAFSGIALLPSFYDDMPKWWQKYVTPGGLKLGLDLQGGMHLILHVDVEKAKENALEFAAQDLKQQLAKKDISVVKTPSPDTREVMFTLPNTASIGAVKDIVESQFPNLSMDIHTSEDSFPRLSIDLTEKKKEFIEGNAVKQSLEVIRNRINQFGVTEPVIVPQGKKNIVVQLPGIKDPERAIKLIGQTAQLTFRKVVQSEDISVSSLINQVVESGKWHKGDGREKLNELLKHKLPRDTEIFFEKKVDRETGKTYDNPLLLKKQVLMTGEMVKDARVRVGGNFNQPYVSLDLTGRGTAVFGEITAENVGQRLAVVLDGVVRSAPVIQEKIMGGKAQITGDFTHEEASDLAIVLRVGALPAPVSIIQNLTVGASLGQDSIDKGLISGLLGAVLVVLFMIVYYRLSGIIANFALLLNVIFLFAALAALQATLTLPGIAGIILTIGMAVDSNVLIFERMREEFALGKSTRSAVDGGYNKAFWTVVDSQVTTLITALALFLFGTGPIKGFAVTLSLGITFNLFTTLFATRVVYDLMYARQRLRSLHFLSFIQKPDFDYMKFRKITFIISGILVLTGLIAFGQILRGQGNLGVDFTGGSLLHYKTERSFSLEKVRDIFVKNGFKDAVLQPVERENRLIVKVKTESSTVGDISSSVTAILAENLPDHDFKLESKSEIGASVSEMLRDKALQAIAISLFGVIIYLALRFDISFGVAAALATFHDVVVIFGLCWLLGVEINLLIVTALLTLAGYSLNDSVVVFDRIRENIFKKDLNLDFPATINLSINEILSRTMVTSLTTLVVLFCLFFLGGAVIHDFAFTLIAGIIVGTYSSIFVASPTLYLWRAAGLKKQLID
ncbi:MAG: protein translocase subunit SecD [Thermodesulfobacteriota bacterium]